MGQKRMVIRAKTWDEHGLRIIPPWGGGRASPQGNRTAPYMTTVHMHGATKQKPTCAGQQNRPVPDPTPGHSQSSSSNVGSGQGANHQPSRSARCRGPVALPHRTRASASNASGRGVGLSPAAAGGQAPTVPRWAYVGGGGHKNCRNSYLCLLCLLSLICLLCL